MYMSEDQFKRLFNYIENRFDGTDKRFDKIDTEVGDVRGAIAELSAQVRDYHIMKVFS